MQKGTIVSAFVALSLLSASVASAQTYSYGSYGAGAPASVSCVNLTRDLSVGSRGAEVRNLQNFLVAQNYPGGGAWMVTGYFGEATRTAVVLFQQQHGIAASGVVDFQTRAAIGNCLPAQAGGSNYSYGANPYLFNNYSNTYNVPFNTYSNTYNNSYVPPQNNPFPTFAPAPVYNYSYNNNPTYGGSLTISSLSISSGPVGSSVTIYGSGFDPVYNNVYLGSMPVPGNIASNGTSLTFTVPASYTGNCFGLGCYGGPQYVQNGTTRVYVTNTHGTSNSLPFTITSGYAFGCPLPGAPNCGYGAYGGYGGYANPTLSYMNPTSGPVGSVVTILGSGFTQRNNAVHFGPGVITGLTSMDGSSISFVIPATLTGFGSQTLSLGTYTVSVTNEQGVTTNSVPFTVTGLAQNSIAPSISSVNGPTSLALGVSGVWTVVINNPNSSNVTTSVRWGDEGSYGLVPIPQSGYASGTQTLTFTHAYQAPGTYAIVFTVSNGAGLQNTSSQTVTVSGSYTSNQPTLSSVSPQSGRVGTLLMLTGNGFTQWGNTVHFGQGGVANVTSSNNGTTLYFTIPYSVSPCDLTPSGCAAPSLMVSPGVYSVYVSNTAGQTSAINFMVTN